MGEARRRSAWRGGALASMLAACAASAFAQQPASTRQHPKPSAPTATPPNPTGAAPSPTLSPLPAPAPPAPLTPGQPTSVTPGQAMAGARLQTTLPPPTLSSAVQSRWSRPAIIARSTSGQCREQCALQRNTCANAAGDTSQCDPGWTRCLSDCEGLSYSRGP